MQLIKNADFSVEVEEKGAELKSLKHTASGAEYLWCADASVWGKTSPNLFPCIGIIKDGFIEHGGIKYPMSRHGFARDTVFSVTEKGEDFVRMTMTDTDGTRKLYPFAFSLEIAYFLKNNTLSTVYTVKNKDKSPMYFALGGHTAFSTESYGGKMADYYLEFDRDCKFQAKKLDPASGLVVEGYQTLGEGRTIDLDAKLFDGDALIFQNIKSKSVTLKNRFHGGVLRVDYADFPNLALWSAKGCDRYLCIEPWISTTDGVKTSNSLKDKSGYVKLAPDAPFRAKIDIAVISSDRW